MSLVRSRAKAMPAVQVQPKFKTGDIVALINTAGAILPSHEERELLEARFEIARQLPNRQYSFQYRIKDTVTGQERAVTEERLREAPLRADAIVEALPQDPEDGELSLADAGAEHGQVEAVNDDAPDSRFPKPARAAPARGR